MKRYKLKQPVKILLIVMIILTIETIYLKIYLDRIEKIENEVKINEKIEK